jgi:hypothetical protein
MSDSAPTSGSVFPSLLLCAFTLFVSHIAAAGQKDPISLESPPADQGAPFIPGVRLVGDLPQDYVEEEYFVAGAATLYSYANNPPLGPTDLTAIQSDVPYKTRLILRRPKKSNKFNGTVVIEWWNSTAGFDTAPVWDASAEYFAERGIAYVGVTNSNQSLNYLVGGCSLLGFLPPTCGTRYSSLSLPDDGLAYEMMSQIANFIRSDDAQNPLPPKFEVERIFHAGQSQQAGSVVTYASAFDLHGLHGINDGYFIQAGVSARTINSGPRCGADGSPPFPACTPRLIPADRLVRTDLLVPVYQLVTETDIEILSFGTFGRQDDTASFRYYEVAGGSHLTVHENIELIPGNILGPDPILLEDLCQNQINSTADGPVFVSYVLNALWERMHEQVTGGASPPAGILMDVQGDMVQRDDLGNGLGGVRLPSMEVPTNTYTSGNQADPALPPLLQQIGNLACFLSGSVTPLDDTTLNMLYRNRGAYRSQISRAVKSLKSQGLLLQSDAVRIKKLAKDGYLD